MSVFSIPGLDEDNKIDFAATMSRVNLESFRMWMLNLDVWGSFQPIGAQCYDI